MGTVFLLAQLVAQTGGQFQATRATAHDHDFMRLLFRCHDLLPACF
jgi:hypothetical protein